MKSIICEVTDLGSKKKTNQDACYVKRLEMRSSDSIFGIICDGVGGCEHSEIASRDLVTAFSDWFTKCYPDFAELRDEDEFCDLLYERWLALFDITNSYIMNFAAVNNIKLGSTLSCILIRDDYYYILHIGDTRIYSINSEIKQLTNDHTVTARELQKGLITPEQARTDRRRHILTKCAGMKDHIRPEFYTGRIEENTKYLLCSDGFRDRTTNEYIAEQLCYDSILKKNKIIKGIKSIIKSNRAEGEKDNITAVVIQVSED